MTLVIGFNGPPHCGKDTIANALAQEINNTTSGALVFREALSLPMRLTGFLLIGEEYSEERYAEIKDEPDPLFATPDGTDTLRQFMIHFSEDSIKNRYGKDFWARQLEARNMALYHRNPQAIIIVSDIGFIQEVEWFRKHTDFLLVHLTREGCDWSKDSRSYCGTPDALIPNNGTVEEAVNHVRSLILRRFPTAL